MILLSFLLERALENNNFHNLLLFLNSVRKQLPLVILAEKSLSDIQICHHPLPLLLSCVTLYGEILPVMKLAILPAPYHHVHA